jgi:hypothetical protein
MSTPIVPFACIPLWTDWGLGPQDGAQALSCLKKFGSVTVLNSDAEAREQRRAFDRLPATGAWNCAVADESAG